ncbi:MAG TPA: DUF3298 domain-containing protein [Candidatus Scybalomonas excrementigallinarum]|nr:DUF3298 domain-containing protein [Candidatus Scybalomonas excrementigallinarum]
MNKNPLEEMKKEYESIEIPTEMKSRLENTIRQAKEENKRVRFFKKIPKKIGYGAVAAVLAITILTNYNEQMAYAMAEVPVLGAISKVVTFREYVKNDGNMEANIKTPKVEGESESVKDLNEQMEAYTNTIKKNYEADLEIMMKEEGADIDALTNKESVTTDYEVVTDNEAILSIRMNTTIAMAGSNSFSKCYTLDKKTGKILQLKDLFQEGSNYQKVISQEIKDQMRTQMKEDEDKSYFIDTKDVGEGFDFEQIKADQNFFIDNDGHLTIVFDKYEVAPGYMGVCTFMIPKKAIEGIITTDSLLK